MQLIASASKDVVALLICYSQDAASTDYVLDIGIGAQGSESVLIPDIVVGAGYSIMSGVCGPFFVRIPKGTRVAARCQASSGSAALRTGVILCEDPGFPQDFTTLSYPIRTPTSFESTFITNSTGQEIIANATANTKGNWAQLIASTSRRTVFMCIMVKRPGVANQEFLIDIGIGGEGSETVIVADFGGWILRDGFSVCHFTLPISIPKNTRVSARAQCTTGGSNFRMHVILQEVD